MPLLNTATKVYAGTSQATAVYQGSTKIWPAETGFIPSELTDLGMWYDADDAATISISSGTTISQWADKSGLGRHLAMTMGSPQLVTNAQNSRDVVSMAPSDQLQYTSAARDIDVSPWTTFAVVKPFGNNSGSPRFLTTLTGTTGNDWEQGNLIICVLGDPALIGPYDATNGPNTTYLSNVYQVWRFHGGDGTWGSYVNGVGVSGSHNPWANLVRVFRVGTASAQAMTAEIGEIILYNRVLTAPETVQVESYLKTKWGI